MRQRVVLLATLAVVAAAVPAMATHVPQDDCGSGDDAGSYGNGVPVELPVTCHGTFDSVGARDSYVISVPDGLVVNAVLTRPGSSLNLLQVFELDDPYTALTVQFGDDVTRLSVHLPAGEFIVSASTYDFSHAAPPEDHNYTLELYTTVFADTSDCGSGHDAQDLWFGDRAYGTPASFATPGSCSAHLDIGDLNDVLTFDTDGSTAYRVNASAPPGAEPLDGVLRANGVRMDLVSEGGVLTTDIVDPGADRTWRLEIDVDEVDLDGLVDQGYVVTVEAIPFPPADDCGLGFEVPAPGAGGPYPALGEGTQCDGELVRGDTGDRFSVDAVSAPAKLVLDYDGPRGTRASAGNDVAGWARSNSFPVLYLSGHEGSMLLDVQPGARSGPYTVSYTIEPDGQDDCDLGHDAPGRHAWVLDVPANTECTARLEFGDLFDWYRLETGDGDMVEISVNGPDPHNDIFWGEHYVEEWPGGDTVDQNWFSASSFSYAERVGGPISWGMAFLQAGEYDIETQVVPASLLNDCASGHDADADRGEAVHIEPPATCISELTTHADRHDDYTLDPPVGDVLVIQLDGANPQLRYRVTDPNGQTYPVIRGEPPADVGFVLVDVPGTWGIRVEGEPQPYVLDVGAVPTSVVFGV